LLNVVLIVEIWQADAYFCKINFDDLKQIFYDFYK